MILKQQGIDSALCNSLFLNGPSSKSNLSQKLNLREGTVGLACDRLIREGLLRQKDTTRKRRVLLEFVPGRFRSLGILHLSDCLVCTLLEANHHIGFQKTFPLPEKSTGSERLSIITDILKTFFIQEKITNLVGAGFCDIGMINSQSGRSVRAALLPGWENIALCEPLEKALGCPVTLVGRSNSWCLAEQFYGETQGKTSLIFILADRNIGLSVMMRGQILSTETGIFGELGHTVVEPSGDICACGNRGCLETVASTDVIIRKVRTHATSDDQSFFGCAPESLTMERIYESARKGHKLSRLTIQEAATAIGNSAAHLVSIFGIPDIVFGGSLIQTDPLCLDTVRHTVESRTVYPLNTQIRIAASRMGNGGSSLGAAHFVLRDYFSRIFRKKQPENQP